MARFLIGSCDGLYMSVSDASHYLIIISPLAAPRHAKFTFPMFSDSNPRLRPLTQLLKSPSFAPLFKKVCIPFKHLESTEPPKKIRWIEYI